MLIEVKTLKDTKQLAEKTAKSLKGNELMLLTGDLGSGKTTFAKYLLEALGFQRNSVSSPSFTLIQEYFNSGKRVYHIDLYRIEKESELSELGLLDILDSEDLVLVEWPEIAEKHFENCERKILKIHFDFKNGKRRVYLTNFHI